MTRTITILYVLNVTFFSGVSFARLALKCDNENITAGSAQTLKTDSSGNLLFGPYAGIGAGGKNIFSLGLGFRPSTVPPNSAMLWIENHDPCDPRIQIRTSASPGVVEIGNETLASETNLYLTVPDNFKLQIGDGDHVTTGNPGHIMATFDPLLNVETVMGSIVVTPDTNNKGGTITARSYLSPGDITMAVPDQNVIHFSSNDVYSLTLTPGQGNLSFYGDLTGYDSTTGTIHSVDINQTGSIQIRQATTTLPACNITAVGTMLLFNNGAGSISMCICEQQAGFSGWSPASSTGACR